MYSNAGAIEANQFQAKDRNETAANRLYEKAAATSLLANLKKLFTTKNTRLTALDEIVKDHQIRNHKMIGIKTVDINQIVGTMEPARKRDFDVDFRPLQQHNKVRWLSVAKALISGRQLPPVSLVQVGQHYFVGDGHHRISVYRAMGERHIEANVVTLNGTGSVSLSQPDNRYSRTLKPAAI